MLRELSSRRIKKEIANEFHLLENSVVEDT